MRGRLRLVALVSSIATWALLSAVFRYLLAATEPTLQFQPTILGERMTHQMHTEPAWFATNGVLVAVGVFLAVRRLPGRTRGDWLRIGAASLVGAVLLGLAITLIGGYSAALLALLSVVWLAAVALARR